MRLGRLDEAEDIHLDVLERMRVVNGDEHPDTMGVVYHLGQLYVAQSDFANAEQQFRIAYDTVASSLGADHRYAIFALSWLAKSVMQQARWSDAKALLERGVETSRQVWPDGNIDVWVFECRLGGVLAELGESDRARSLLEGCHSMLVDVLGADAEDSLLAGQYLETVSTS